MEAGSLKTLPALWLEVPEFLLMNMMMMMSVGWSNSIQHTFPVYPIFIFRILIIKFLNYSLKNKMLCFHKHWFSWRSWGIYFLLFSILCSAYIFLWYFFKATHATPVLSVSLTCWIRHGTINIQNWCGIDFFKEVLFCLIRVFTFCISSNGRTRSYVFEFVHVPIFL